MEGEKEEVTEETLKCRSKRMQEEEKKRKEIVMNGRGQGKCG